MMECYYIFGLFYALPPPYDVECLIDENGEHATAYDKNVDVHKLGLVNFTTDELILKKIFFYMAVLTIGNRKIFIAYKVVRTKIGIIGSGHQILTSMTRWQNKNVLSN